MKRARSRKSAPVLSGLAGEPSVARVQGSSEWSGLVGGWGYGGGHQAADQSRGRGFVYFPEFDTRKEISSYTRMEVLRKARYLYANVGFARRIVNGISRMVAGTGLMPRPMTLDKEWNKLALARIEAVFGSASTYDLSGKFNFYRAQRAKLRCRYKDGDVATVLTRDPRTGRAATAIYEGHQIGSGRLAEGEEKTVFDGIRVDRYNRMVAMRLLEPEGTGFSEVPAASALLLADFERPAQNRCLSIFSHAVNHLLDKTEIDSYYKGSIKNSARIGYYIGSAKDTVPVANPKPGASAGNRTIVTGANGEKVSLEKVYSSSGGEVPRLDPGQELKMLLDERPHPNTLEFAEYLIRDASLGVDLSPELLWSIVKLGGANVRYVMAEAQSFIECEQQTLVDTTLGPEYIYFVADEMAAGRLRPCLDPEWWKHGFITPARTTIDIGRDGKLHLSQIQSGALTFRRFFGWQGLGLDELDEWLDEMAYVIRGCAARPELADDKMKQFVLQALYQRVGLASALDAGPLELAAAGAAEDAEP
jgi:capsid protein